MDKISDENPREKAGQYDRLGDLCCALKAYPAAAKFYGKQVCDEWEEDQTNDLF